MPLLSRTSLLFAMSTLFVVAAAPACGGDEDARPRPDVDGPVSRDGGDGGPGTDPDPTDGGKGAGAARIDLPADGTYGKRTCDVVLRYEGAASSVSLISEITGWATAPLPFTKTGAAFELTVSPSANVTAGALYGYKLVVDGTPILDPKGTRRKLEGGFMNSAFVLPACAAGPEVTSGPLTADGAGHAKVTVTVRSAEDGAKPVALLASLDGAPLAPGSGAATVDGASGTVSFAFSGLPKGKHRLSLRAVDASTRESAPVDLPFWIEDEAFSYRDGLLYMFMVDRFANGQAANDGKLGAPVEYDADWHGGDMEGALAVLKSGYFEKLGVRTIWLSPLNRQTNKYETGDGNKLFSAYHGYWPVRAREVEPRFGGDAALRAFIEEAHRRGLRVLLDLINNQVHEDHEYVGPHADWFRRACTCGTSGCGWSERPFDCLFQPYLPDIDWTKPGAATRFVEDAIFWISEFDFDGFRVDAVKHVESNSIYNLRAELNARFEQGGHRVFMVGETAVGEFDRGSFFGENFSDGYAWIDAYTGENALDGQFDFPTRHRMADGLVSGTQSLADVEAALATAESRYGKDSLHVRFLNGHDNPRIASIAAQDPKLGCTWASGCRGDQLPPATYTDPAVFQRLRRGLVTLYTLPGVPYLYAGDEVAFGGGADPDMRRDMRFAEADLAGVQMRAPGATIAPLTAAQLGLRDFARKLGTVRAASQALRRGARTTLLGSDQDLWVYAYEDGAKAALVVVNRGGAVNGRTIGKGSLTLPNGALASPLGVGSASVSGSRIALQIPAGEATIFTTP